MSTPERKRLLSHYEKQLTPFSTSLVAEFHRAADAIGDEVSDEELSQWADDGIELARQSWRSWEAAGEYFRVTPQVLPSIGFDAFRRWTKSGRDLAEMSSALAASYFRASPTTPVSLISRKERRISSPGGCPATRDEAGPTASSSRSGRTGDAWCRRAITAACVSTTPGCRARDRRRSPG